MEEDLREGEDEEVFNRGERADLRGAISIRCGRLRAVLGGDLGAIFSGGNRGTTTPGLTLTGSTFTGLTLTGLRALTFTGLDALIFIGFETFVLMGLEEPRPTLRPGMAGRVEGR